MDSQEPGRPERSSSEQSLQFNPFLQEIGFYKQTKAQEGEYEDTQKQKACKKVIQSIRSCKKDIDATYQRLKQKQSVKHQSQKFYKKENDGEAHSSQSQQFLPYSSKTAPTIELKNLIKKVNSCLKSILEEAKRPIQKRIKSIEETLDVKNGNFVQLNSQKPLQQNQRDNPSRKQHTRLFSPIFVEPIKKYMPKSRFQKIIRNTTKKNHRLKIGNNINRSIFPSDGTEEQIYFNRSIIQNDKYKKRSLEAEGYEELVKIKQSEQKRNEKAIDLAVFQAYKEDNQYIVQEAIKYLIEISTNSRYPKMKKQFLSKENIEAYCFYLNKTGFVSFMKYQSQILHKRINQIIQQYSKSPIEGIDIKLQILSHFFRSDSIFNAYLSIKQQKIDRLELKSHLCMLNYSTDELRVLKNYFLRHQNEIKYFDRGFDLEKIANTFIFLLRKSRLEKPYSQSLNIVPSQYLVSCIKAQRKQLIRKKVELIEQSQKQYFSIFVSKLKTIKKKKREWSSQQIFALHNNFNKMISWNKQDIVDEIKQITKRFGRSFERNYLLFENFKSNFVKFSHELPQIIAKEKNGQIRRSLNRNPKITILQMQRKIFFSQGIYVSLDEIEENIDNQLQILIKQLLFDYMQKTLLSVSKLSMHQPIGFIDTFTTTLQLQLQQNEIVEGQSRVQSKQVTFCFAVSSDGRAACKIFFDNVDLEVLLSSIIYRLDKISTFASRDAQFLTQNWFQRQEIKYLHRMKTLLVPLPSLVSIPNPCKDIMQRIQFQVSQHRYNQTSLRLLAQNLIKDLDSQTIKKVFAQKISQSKRLFSLLKAEHLKAFETTRTFQFQDMRLLIIPELSHHQDQDKKIVFKRQTRQLYNLKPPISQNCSCKETILPEQNLKDKEIHDFLLQQMTDVIRGMSLEDRRKAVGCLIFYNEKQLLQNKLSSIQLDPNQMTL